MSWSGEPKLLLPAADGGLKVAHSAASGDVAREIGAGAVTAPPATCGGTSAAGPIVRGVCDIRPSPLLHPTSAPAGHSRNPSVHIEMQDP